MGAATIAMAMEVVLSLLSRSAEISEIIRAVNASGRDEFTPEEWAAIEGNDAAARKKLVDAIAAARAKEITPP